MVSSFIEIKLTILLSVCFVKEKEWKCVRVERIEFHRSIEAVVWMSAVNISFIISHENITHFQLQMALFVRELSSPHCLQDTSHNKISQLDSQWKFGILNSKLMFIRIFLWAKTAHFLMQCTLESWNIIISMRRRHAEKNASWPRRSLFARLPRVYICERKRCEISTACASRPRRS